MSLSDNIRRLRTERGMTQEELAGALGVSSQAVSKWECSETYPDGALLVPLAEKLETSLDDLFGYTPNNGYVKRMKTISRNIRSLMLSENKEDRFDAAFDIGLQTLHGMFNTKMSIEDVYDPDEIKIRGTMSEIINDNGFMLLSRRDIPFYAVFPTKSGDYDKLDEYKDKIHTVFECLADEDTMRAVRYVFAHENGYTFEREVLAKECGTEEDKINKVVKNLSVLNLVSEFKLDIDGAERYLCTSKQNRFVIMLLTAAAVADYCGNYNMQSENAHDPMVK